MLGKRSAQLGLFEADTRYADFIGKRTFYGYHRTDAFVTWVADGTSCVARCVPALANYAGQIGQSQRRPSYLDR